MHILVLSDIHANYPALQAIENYFSPLHFDLIINCGDSLVYAPFPNETLSWLINHKAVSILGNTDKKVIKLLRRKTFKKPSTPEKRVMYTWTAEKLSRESSDYLLALDKKMILQLSAGTDALNTQTTLGIFHGSPAKNHEFLFASTPDSRFLELASLSPHCDIAVFGHSHSPFHKHIGSTHFINPGSVGRMFDGDPRASCATLQITSSGVRVNHFRIGYNVAQTVDKLSSCNLPKLYGTMFQTGRKLN